LQAAREDAGHARLPSEADAAAGCLGAAAGEPLSSGDAGLLGRAVAAAGLPGAAETVGRVLRECSVVAAMHPDQARRPGGGFKPQAATRASGAKRPAAPGAAPSLVCITPHACMRRLPQGILTR